MSSHPRTPHALSTAVESPASARAEAPPPERNAPAAVPESSGRRGGLRLSSLDGLRGLAAVTVVAWHAIKTTDLQNQIYLEPFHAEQGSVLWWLFNTPLRLLSMGEQAVALFFVLSGVVLVLPLLQGRALDAWEYVPRRLARLWIPTAIAGLLAALLYRVSSPSPDAASGWVNKYSSEPLEPGTVLNQMFPLMGDNYLNNPAWSLAWELLFSLLLPGFFLLALAARRHLWTTIVAMTVLVGVGAQYEVPPLQYLPLFVAGGLCARILVERPALPGWRAGALAVGGLLLICAGDLFRIVTGYGDHTERSAWTAAGTCLGSAMLVVAAVWAAPLRRLLSTRPVTWLGRISFSLYLVHVPILLATLHLMGSQSPGRALLVSIPLSFVVAALFRRAVELPSQRWAQAIGRASVRLVAEHRAVRVQEPAHEQSEVTSCR